MDEGRKRVLAIVAGILVARHLKTTEDLFDSKPSPRTESLVSAAVQWAEKIMKKIDGVSIAPMSLCSLEVTGAHGKCGAVECPSPV
jgi:hypothetical protein